MLSGLVSSREKAGNSRQPTDSEQTIKPWKDAPRLENKALSLCRFEGVARLSFFLSPMPWTLDKDIAEIQGERGLIFKPRVGESYLGQALGRRGQERGQAQACPAASADMRQILYAEPGPGFCQKLGLGPVFWGQDR